MHLVMAKRRSIFGILLAVSLLALIIGGNSTQPELQQESQTGIADVSSSFSFIAGAAPVADAQASYIVAVPAAASMDAPSRASIAEASNSLSGGQSIVFRCIKQMLPIPFDGGKRRLLLKVLRI